MAYCVRLESEYTERYREFKSRPLRHPSPSPCPMHYIYLIKSKKKNWVYIGFGFEL